MKYFIIKDSNEIEMDSYDDYSTAEDCAKSVAAKSGKAAIYRVEEVAGKRVSEDLVANF